MVKHIHPIKMPASSGSYVWIVSVLIIVKQYHLDPLFDSLLCDKLALD